jgi:S-adenosylmethionine:tRNA ribosyltransferase-isomerase
MRSSKGAAVGGLLVFGGGVVGEIQEVLEDGLVRIRFSGEKSIDALLEEEGRIPLPPYIRRENEDGLSALDRERCQTLFARERGAVAAPTAGLHFSLEVIDSLERAGVQVAPLTLHVGYGTFRPVRTGDIRNHRVGEEFFRIGAATAEAVNRTRQDGGRVIAVGTTVVRALESGVTETGRLRATESKTDLLITPGYPFRVVDGLITNFHLPKSSLLFLVCAFAGLERTREAYRLAVSRKYRFYSYGDAMLIL